MASTITIQKRQRESARQERNAEKEAQRKLRREEKASRTPGAEGEDPDIAGIVPGPQPILPEFA